MPQMPEALRGFLDQLNQGGLEQPGIGGAAFAGGLPMAFAQGGGSPSGPRVAALGWACAQTILALGMVPLVVPEIERYGRLVVEPAVQDVVYVPQFNPWYAYGPPIDPWPG